MNRHTMFIRKENHLFVIGALVTAIIAVFASVVPAYGATSSLARSVAQSQSPDAKLCGSGYHQASSKNVANVEHPNWVAGTVSISGIHTSKSLACAVVRLSPPYLGTKNWMSITLCQATSRTSDSCVPGTAVTESGVYHEWAGPVRKHWNVGERVLAIAYISLGKTNGDAPISDSGIDASRYSG